MMGEIQAVVLLSGGMDSTVVAAAAARAHGASRVAALHVAYGQRHGHEESASARRVARVLMLAEFAVASANLSDIVQSPLTAHGAVPLDRTDAERSAGLSPMIVPGRNLVLASLANALAESRGATHLYLGVNADDRGGFPDCRWEFWHAARPAFHPRMLNLPLVDLDKAGIVRLGRDLGAPLEESFSCYQPVRGEHCHRCDACVLRDRALATA